MSVFTNFANSIRDGILDKQDLKDRQEATRFCTAAKIACVAAAIVVASVAVFSILSGTFAGVVLGAVIGGVGLSAIHDGYRFFDNVQNIFDDAITELFSRLDKERMKTQLTRGMIFARPLVESWIDSQQARRS